MVLWWIGDLILLFVVLPVVLALLNRVVTPIERIRATIDDIDKNATELLGLLDNVPELLAETDSTVKEVSVGAIRYVTRVGQLLGS